MEPLNDNRPPAEASRVLPILGVVDRRGRVVFAPERGPDGGTPAGPGLPNDPREA